MSGAVVLGDWCLRHGEPGEDSVSVHLIGDGMDADAVSRSFDLRDWGLPNMSGGRLPLAVVRVTGETVELRGLLARQDVHRVHFLKPGPLASCERGQLALAIRNAFARHHLALNNFECCSFPVADSTGMAMHMSLDDLHIGVLADDVIGRIDEGLWPGFQLKQGKTIQRLAGEAVVLRSLADGSLLVVRPGTVRKKRRPEATGWQMETHRRAGEGGWFRVKSDDIDEPDLAGYDQRPETVAALLGQGPLAKLAVVSECVTRVLVEAGRSGAIYELDLGLQRIAEGSKPPISGLSLSARSAIARVVTGRKPVEPAEARRDLADIARYLGATADANRRCILSDAPAGLVPAAAPVLPWSEV